MKHEDLKRLKSYKESYILKNFPNVVGVGVSRKHKNNKPTDNLAMTVYVTKKIPIQELEPKHIINTNSFVLSGLDSPDDIDVKEIGVIRKHATAVPKEQTMIRPVQAGTSEGHYLITAGTGGPLVQNVATKTVYRVSNNHVYANENNAKLGDPIYQPGPYDGGVATSRVGTLAKFIPIDFKNINIVDCALRTTQTNESDVIYNINKIPSTIIEPEIGMVVIKQGRTTGITTGSIQDVSLTIKIEYDGGLATFENQILISSETAFSQGGDSGSGIYKNTGNDLEWVALLFAGSDDGTYTIANHALKVAENLEIELYDTKPTPLPPPSEPPKNTVKIIGIITLIIAALAALIKLVT